MTNRLLIRTETRRSRARPGAAGPADPHPRHHRARGRRRARPAGRAHPDRDERVLRGERRLLGSADRHGRAAGRQRQGQVDPGQLPVLVQEGRAAVRRAVDDPGRDRHGGKRQRPDHPARRAQRAERLRRGRADADRHRRRGRQRLGRPAGPPGQPGGQRRRHRRGRRPERGRLRPRRRDRGRGQVPARGPVRRPTPRRRSSPTTTCSPTCRACCTTRAQYAGGNFSVVSAQMPSGSSAAGCATTTGGVPAVQAPTQAVATAISFAEQQLGKPYLWGGTGPDAFDCSGLVMMAYRTAGINIERTSRGAVGDRAAGACLPGAAGGPGVLRRLGRYHHLSGARRPGDREREDDRGVRDGLPDPRLQLRQPRGDRFHPTLGSGRSQCQLPAASTGAFDGRHAHPGHRHLSLLTSLWLTGLVGSRPGCRGCRYTVRKE